MCHAFSLLRKPLPRTPESAGYGTVRTRRSPAGEAFFGCGRPTVRGWARQDVRAAGRGLGALDRGGSDGTGAPSLWSKKEAGPSPPHWLARRRGPSVARAARR
ncbi:hypothetical protein GCM10010321_17960 [Streptomyces chartreusis]|nr:hypothetical protein GCM10010321_17960 [Streptomyces chartreusis]